LPQPSRLLATALVLAALLAAPAASAASTGKTGGAYTHPQPVGVQVGDIVFGHSPGIVDDLIPGYWTHVGVVAAYDPQEGWLVVEALPGRGVVLTPLSQFLSRYPTVALAHVDAAPGERQAAAQFALQQLGKPYDYNYLTKEAIGPSYYCSELAWASYKAIGGPDIDQNPGWTLKYADAVAPQEIYDDNDTAVYYFHSAS